MGSDTGSLLAVLATNLNSLTDNQLQNYVSDAFSLVQSQTLSLQLTSSTPLGDSGAQLTDFEKHANILKDLSHIVCSAKIIGFAQIYSSMRLAADLCSLNIELKHNGKFVILLSIFAMFLSSQYTGVR